MLVKVLGYILTYLFSFIFKTSQETAQTARDDLVSVFSAISKIGAYKIKEFLAAIPIFIEFFIHLVAEREKLEKNRQLILIGAAAALSTLVGFLIVSVLGSWTVQAALVISIPLIGVPLVLATGLAITTIVVLFIWLVVFVLNKALADDPEYKIIRDRYLLAPVKQCLSDIENRIDESQRYRPVETLVPFNPDYLYQLVELQLLAQGEKSDVDKIAARLEIIQAKLAKESSQREIFLKAANKVNKMSEVTTSHVLTKKESNNSAMIICPDCNGELSDLAPTCPHCGRPNARLDQQPRNIGFLLGTGIFLIPLIFSWFTLRKGHTTTARVVSFAWLALIMMIVLGTDTSTTP